MHFEGVVQLYLNEDEEIEDIDLLQCADLDKRNYFESEINDIFSDEEYIISTLKEKNIYKKDTLYHIYFKLNQYGGMSFYEDDYTEELKILEVIPFINNYSSYINRLNKETEQNYLSIQYNSIGTIELPNRYGGWFTHTNISYEDIVKLINYIKEKDIRLAHRFAINLHESEILGNDFNELILNTETRRIKLTNYLKNLKHKTLYNFQYIKDGISIEKNGKTIKIYFHDIDNLSNEILNKTNEQILEYLINTKLISMKLLNENDL